MNHNIGYLRETVGCVRHPTTRSNMQVVTCVAADDALDKVALVGIPEGTGDLGKHVPGKRAEAGLEEAVLQGHS